jgi:hypothetical protein
MQKRQLNYSNWSFMSSVTEHVSCLLTEQGNTSVDVFYERMKTS